MTESEARLLLHHLRLRGYVAELEFYEIDGNRRWHVYATRLHSR